MTTSSQQFPIRTRCPLCGYSDVKPLLKGRPDYEYGVSVSLPYAFCQNPACGLVFASAMPTTEVIQGFYTKYSTHGEYHPTSAIAMLLALASSKLRKRSLMSLFDGKDVVNIKVLDYGCGAGDFMRQLTRFGIKHVAGYDFDPMACRHVRALGLQAFETQDEFEAAGPYDYIFLNHVIEHLSDPVASLTELASYLGYGGRLVVRTPNAESFLAQLFGSNWRGWETPRHLHVFNPRSSRQLVAAANIPGCKIIKANTSNAMFFGMFHESFHASFWHHSKVGKLLRHLTCMVILPVAYIANGLRRDIGEEVCFILEKEHFKSGEGKGAAAKLP